MRIKLLIIFILFFHLNDNCYSQTTNKNAQNIIFKGDDFAAVYKAVEKYHDYYSDIENVQFRMIEKLNDQEFRSLFDDELNSISAKGIMPSDFPDTSDLQILTPGETNNSKINLNIYVNSLAGAIAYNDYSFIYSCRLTPMDSIYYCAHDNYWYVWIRKSILYKSGGNEKTMQNITKITFTKPSKLSNSYKITNIDLVDKFPKDEDGDFIADECDICIHPLSAFRTNILTPSGCADTYLDGKSPPASRFAITLSGGVVSTLNNEFTDNDIKDGNAIFKPGYFSKTGFSIDLNGILTLNKLLGLRFGFIFTQNNIDSKALENAVSSFMQDNGYSTTIRFNNTSRQLLIPHVDVRIGNFNNAKSVLSIEATIGLALTDLFFLNKDLSYSSRDSNLNQQSEATLSHISFKSSPFGIYGGKINYEFSPRDELGKFFVNFYYLTGNYTFNNQEIIAPTTGKKIVFEGSTLQLWGVSAGIYFNLLKPKIWKEIQKLHTNAASTILYK